MGGENSWFSRSKTPTPAKSQAKRAPTAAPGTQALALGNQDRLALAGGDAAPPSDPRHLDALKQAILARGPAAQQAAHAQEQSPAQRAEEAVQTQEGGGRQSLMELQKNLKNSKRGGIHISGGNSQLYDNVMSALDGINGAMRQRFTLDAAENQNQLFTMEKLYQNLIDACAKYAARSPSTSAGQARKEIVTQIQAIASRDFISLGSVRTDFCSLTPEQQSRQDWNTLLDQARTIHLTTSDFSKLDKAGGGAASEVYKVTGNQVSVTRGQEQSPLEEMQFFKPEDEIDLDSGANRKNMVFQAMLQRFPNLSKADKANLQKYYLEGKEMKGQLSDEGVQAKQFLTDRESAMNTTIDNVLKPSGVADEGGKVNTTRRNVATSRVAALMGLEGLVAKSETAEITDEATGKSIRGNLMAKAKGGEFDALKGTHAADAKKGEWQAVSGGFQRDMINLQVLDFICGQLDRHNRNIMYQQDKSGRLVGLQGIDNDGSFGTNEDSTILRDAYRKDKRVVDPATKELTVPYMDKNLAERVKALDPKMIRFALAGLLSDAEIDAAVKRLETVQQGFAKSMEQTPEKFLEDDQWNENTAKDLLEDDFQAQRNFTVVGNNETMAYRKQLAIEHPEWGFAPGTMVDTTKIDKKYRPEYENLLDTFKHSLNQRLIDQYGTRGNAFGRMMLELQGINPMFSSADTLGLKKK